MSERKADDQEGAQGGNALPDDVMRLLPLVNAGVLVLLLVLAVVSAVLVYGVSDQVSTLESQTRKLLKTTQSLAEQLDAVTASVESTRAKPAAEAAAPRAPVHIDAADPHSDCVIRSGDKKGLADCMGR